MDSKCAWILFCYCISKQIFYISLIFHELWRLFKCYRGVDEVVTGDRRHCSGWADEALRICDTIRLANSKSTPQQIEQIEEYRKYICSHCHMTQADGCHWAMGTAQVYFNWIDCTNLFPITILRCKSNGIKHKSLPETTCISTYFLFYLNWLTWKTIDNIRYTRKIIQWCNKKV